MSFFFFNDTATTEIYTLSLHDALPISSVERAGTMVEQLIQRIGELRRSMAPLEPDGGEREELGGDRKSTRLNSSHSQISYAVFCLKKKKKIAHGMRLYRHCHTSVLQER